MVAYLGYSMDISEENLSVGNTTVDTRAIDVMGATRAFRWVRKSNLIYEQIDSLRLLATNRSKDMCNRRSLVLKAAQTF